MHATRCRMWPGAAAGLALLAGWPFAGPASAQEPDAATGVVAGELGARLDDYLARAEAFGFNGAVLVAVDGSVVLRKGYGLADRARGVPITAETVFDIGSITKQFTASAILRLEEQGRLQVTDSIALYFDDVPPDKAGITIHHLLTHSAGLKDVFGDDYEVMPRDSLVSLALHSELLWEPGTRYRYSNAGYSLLGAIIEKVSGQPYEEFLRQQLFEPAGLEQTGYRIPDWPEDRIAHGYIGDSDWGTPLEKLWAEDGPYWNLRANGGLLSTVGDLYRWHLALQADAVLSAGSKQKMFTPHVPENDEETSFYGYGWAITPTSRGTTLVWHNGGNGIFFADFRRYVDEQVVLIFATNEDASEPVERQIVRMVFGREYAQLPVAAVDLSETQLERYAGTYRLPSGLEIEVVVQDGGLEIPAQGAEVATLFLPVPELDEDAMARLEGIEEISTAVVAGMARGRFGPFREHFVAIGDFDVDGEVAFWTAAFRGWKQRYGDFTGSKVLGTASGASEYGPTLQTYVLVSFERGTRLIAFVQGAAGPKTGFYLEAMPPTALSRRLRFVPLSDTEFASFDFRSESQTRIEFKKDAEGKIAGLRIPGHGAAGRLP